MDDAVAQTQKGDAPAVRGAIAFEPDSPHFRNATAYVRLEDVSVADGSARLIAEKIVRDVSNPPSGGLVPFVVSAEPVDERIRYNIRVLVDLDGDGQTSPGDYITVQSYPVLARGHPAEVVVEVRRVNEAPTRPQADHTI
jgi:uncharacterized lipoprotein YbaY